jgi:NAD-dependent SIR2 family protein deacetylase
MEIEQPNSSSSASNLIWHGLLGNNRWQQPTKVVDCDLDARPGYASVQAHEYEDDPIVLRQKVQFLAYLLTQSRNCIIYTGAGISTASGIGDYATKSKTKFSNQKLKSHLLARPTLAHRVLVAMYHQGLVKRWVQQNHDGLPQKAGFPQHAINEIHGAWYDPTNPVVPMTGELRNDLQQDMYACEENSDLTIAIGTSMCGMNADRVFTTVSEKVERREQKKLKAKSRHGWNPQPIFEDKRHKHISIGGVIIGIQQTQYDSIASLRIFSRIDHVMEMLHEVLELPPIDMTTDYSPQIPPTQLLRNDTYRIPYDQQGNLLSDPDQYETESTVLNLSLGSEVMMVSGPYQGDRGRVIMKTPTGHYKIEFTHTLDYRKNETIAPYLMDHILGSWWVEAAVLGTLPQIPLVNCNGGR